MAHRGRVLVTGGAGYVGSVLVPALLQKKYPVTVLDTFWFWDSPEEFVQSMGLPANLSSRLRIIKGDIRDGQQVRKALDGAESVIHLACVSNDPSSELDPAFTHSVNYGGSVTVIDAAKSAGVKRFIYASSSSVYGIKAESKVTEEMSLEPLTQYSRLKVEIEHYLLHRLDDAFRGVVVRPSTVCGYSPRQRFDVVVNIFAHSAATQGKIIVFGGKHKRPNIHIKDMARLYECMLEAPLDRINGKVYNVGDENLEVMQIALLVQEIMGNVAIEIQETNDPRSYHICSDKIKDEVGFMLHYSVREAISDLKDAFETKKIADPGAERYFNVRRMKKIIAQLHDHVQS